MTAESLADHSAHFVLGAGEYRGCIDFSRTTDNTLHNAVCDVLTNHLPYDVVHRAEQRYSLYWLVTHADELEARQDDEGMDAAAHAAFMAVVRAEAAEQERVFQQRLKDGKVEMYHIPRLFPVGTHVVIDGEEPVAGPLVELTLVETMFGPKLQVTIEVIHAMQGTPQFAKHTAVFPTANCVQPIAALPLRVLDDGMREELTARGAQFIQAMTPGTYLAYEGQLVQENYWGNRLFRADGRVVVDPISFAQNDGNLWRGAKYGASLEDEDGHQARGRQPTLTVQEQDLWRCWPYLHGFSLSAKQWGRLTVSQLSPIQWRDDAFSRVVMPEDQKKRIHALVKHHGVGFTDFIDGKGGGCIFLLHGEPGGGKTLISESVAEVLHKPLYSVSVGELGTDPDNLESRLRAILDVATIWDAVILLDEADIFLEARDDHNVQRNAMVSIFLRLLEYHNGVLFMTTNRVKHIDRAFYSRISVAIHFPPATVEKREKIWANLLDATQMDSAWAAPLANLELNGRQIKNVIRQAQTIAFSEDRAVALKDLQDAAQYALAFEQEMQQP